MQTTGTRQPLVFSEEHFYQVVMEKMAAAMVDADVLSIEMPDDISAWPAFIEQRLRKSYPFLGLYRMVVELMNLDEDSRTAFGRVRIYANQGEAVPPMEPSAGAGMITPVPGGEQQLYAKGGQGGPRTVTRFVDVPVIINQGKLASMDVFVHQGKSWPITKTRISRALFRPAVADDSVDVPGSNSGMTVMMSPSAALQAGYGGSGSLGYQKVSSAADLLHKVASRDLGKASEMAEFLYQTAQEVGGVMPLHIKQAAEILGGEELAKTAAAHQAARNPFIGWLRGQLPFEKVAQQLAASVIPDVTLMYRDDMTGDYVVKTASHKLFYPVEHHLDRGQALNLVGEHLVKMADIGRKVVAVASDAEENPDTQTIVEVAPDNEGENLGPAARLEIDRPGIWYVETPAGTVRAAAFPIVIDPFTGEKEPYTLVSSGVVGGIAGKPAYGIPAGGTLEESMPVAKPGGLGFWVYRVATPGGMGWEATPMMELGSASVVNGVTQYSCRFLDGAATHCQMSTSVKKPVFVGKAILMPVSARWVPVGKMVEISTSTGPSQDIIDDQTVKLTADGYRFRLEGRPVSDLNIEGKDLDPEEAALILGALGVDNDTISRLTQGRSRREGPRTYYIYGCRTIKVLEPTLKKWLASLAVLDKEARSLAVDLTKEAAAVIRDPDSVDALLSLNFINAETLQEFVDHLPVLESTLSLLADLLTSVRLGLANVPEAAVRKAMTALDKVIDGIERLRYAAEQTELTL